MVGNCAVFAGKRETAIRVVQAADGTIAYVLPRPARYSLTDFESIRICCVTVYLLLFSPARPHTVFTVVSECFHLLRRFYCFRYLFQISNRTH